MNINTERTLSVRLNNRLGNQMFQYAFARAMSLRMGISLVYLVGEEASRLDCFSLPETIQYAAAPVGITSSTSLASRIIGKIAALLAHHPRSLYAVTRCLQPLLNACGVFFCLDGYITPRIKRLTRRSIYCSGYFQTERYFADQREVIRRDFQFNESLRTSCELMSREIQSCCSVCVHIRLGDFLQLPNYQVCDADYYRRAIAYIREQQPDARFFVFSDDPERAQSYLADIETTVLPSCYTDQQSLYLGTLCRHHILSNSSFSWWMQYLGHSPGQMVVAPRRWMNDHTPTPQYQSHWITI